MDSVPETFPINHDDYHARHIGRTADGRQFFLTTPFVPAIGDESGGEYIALFMFDANGKLLDATIDSLRPRSTLDKGAASKRNEQRLAALGDVEFCDIRIAPFKTESTLKRGVAIRSNIPGYRRAEHTREPQSQTRCTPIARHLVI